MLNAVEAAKRNLEVREHKISNLYNELYLTPKSFGPYIAVRSSLPKGGTDWSKHVRVQRFTKARNRKMSKVAIPNSMPRSNQVQEYLRDQRPWVL